jgi:hypothetical protein
MTVLWIESFDQFGTNKDNLLDVTEYSGFAFSVVSSPFGGYHVKLAFNADFIVSLSSTYSTLVMGARMENYRSAEIYFLGESVNYHGKIVHSTVGEVMLYDSTGALKATSDVNAWPVFGYFYVECKLVLNTLFEVRVNGKVVVSDNTGDYQYGSEELVGIKWERATADLYVDNLYITDGEYLGEVEVKVYVPEVDGTHGDFVPSTGSDHFAVVDEIPANETDYLIGSADGDKESFITTPSIVGPIKAVMVQNRMKKDGGLGLKVKNLVRVGGGDYLGSSELYLGSDYQTLVSVWPNNPNTSNPWSKAEAEGVEFGLQITGLSTTTTT